MPIKIPVHLVPRAFVDFDMEQLQILGLPFCLPDGFCVPPLTPARLMALEIVCSDFFLHPDTCTQLDAAAALVLISCDRTLVQELTSAALPTVSVGCTNGDTSASEAERTTSAPLAVAAAAFLHAHGDAMLADYTRLVRWCIEVPFYGFDMIPKTPGGQPSECWFDGVFAGSVVAQAAKILATPVDRVLWDTSLCLVWHTIAQHAAAYGVKHIERPPDEAALKAMMEEAAARESRGELHPWQYADPFSYALTAAQADANPALIGLFAEMRAEYERNGHKPLDPAKFPLPCAGEDGLAAPAGTSVSCTSVDERTITVEVSSSCAGAAERTLTVEVQPHV